MSSIYDWSLTEANNANADSSINWQEGQLPSTVNNSARYMMRRGKELLNDIGFVATAGGTANTITLTASSPFAAYADGMFVTFRAAVDNTGAATLNVNAAGAKNIYKSSLNGALTLVGGEIPAGALCRLAYVAALNAAVGGWLIVETSKEPIGRGHIYGLTLSNSSGDVTNDIDVAAGDCASDAGSPILMTLASALTKRLDAAWAVGTNAGGLDTGAIADTTYHVWLIQRSDTGVVDALFSTSATAPTMPANYDRKRRVGAIIRESAAIVPFTQMGDYFSRAVKVERDSTAALVSTTISLGVPAGIVVRPVISSQLVVPASSNIAFSVGNGNGSATSYLAQTAFTGTGEASSDVTQVSTLLTNTSRQIYIEVSITSGSITIFRLRSHGWFDTRQ
ncbi:hypothetical protein ELG76_04215 [Rhizobium leguminosarum]|uniref:hypothetical protein n=1 Tax=Rhizobium leguminosarum TaxID=384 RepID=UPI001030889C|nr:hypothetical protein [Rhizobium leguminosarum]TBG78625.1 hypothetical protein ELG76_04215 [Rhizobium leguminosarum]